MLAIYELFKRTWNRWQAPHSLHEDGLETIIEYRQRRRSINIINFTLFLRSLGFSIVTSGIWPYLDKLDPNAGKVFMGYVVAANPLGQMLFDPLIGHWASKIKSVRLPLNATIILFCLTNALYSCLGAFPIGSVKYAMLLARFLSGVGSANLSLCRTYIVEATRESERMSAISMSSMVQAISLVVGPALQTCVSSLGENGITIIPGLVILNMYTAPGWINVAVCIANIVLCLPIFLKEKRIAALEVMTREGLTTEEETYKNIRIDYFVLWTLLAGIFVTCFDFTAIQSISTSMTMDQFAWSHAEALYYVSVIMTAGSIVSIPILIAIPALCRRFSERNVLIFVGFLLTILGCGLNIPFFGGNPPIMAEHFNLSMDAITGISQNFTIDNTATTTLVGCPISQKWCRTTPALPMTQFVIGYLFTSSGYPISLTLIQITYNRVLGCRPQGLWLGLFSVSMLSARILGPIFTGNIYPQFGMYWTFGCGTVIALLGMFWTWLLRKRLKAPIRPTVTNDPVVFSAKL